MIFVFYFIYIQNFMKIGFAVFKQEISQRHYSKLFTKEIIEILSDDSQWWLCLGIYKENWSTLFSLMVETSVLKIELGRNENPRIIKQIQDINFLKLKALCFGKNRIVNIQMIQYINAPHLQWLSFGIQENYQEENYLSNIRSLRKVHFRKLKVLNLKTNKINQIDLRELHAPQLSKITTEPFHSDELQGESLNWVFTLQSKSLLILRCRSDQRIKSTLFQNALKRKYPMSNIKRFEPTNIDEEENSQSDHV